MLPTVSLSALRRSATAAIAALSLAAVTAAPAHAWGKNEQNFLKGVLATVAVGAIIKQAQRNNAPRYATSPQYYADPAPTYRAPTYQTPTYRAPNYRTPAYSEPVYRAPAYGTPVAVAFSEYSPASKRAIQQRLRAYGYYSGSVDGVFGPATQRAIEAYARDTGGAGALGSRDGSVRLMNSLLT